MNAGAAGINGPQVGILGVKGIPYQGDQMAKIVEVLGTPERKRRYDHRMAWGSIDDMPSLYSRISRPMARYRSYARLPAICPPEPVREMRQQLRLGEAASR